MDYAYSRQIAKIAEEYKKAKSRGTKAVWVVVLLVVVGAFCITAGELHGIKSAMYEYGNGLISVGMTILCVFFDDIFYAFTGTKISKRASAVFMVVAGFFALLAVLQFHKAYEMPFIVEAKPAYMVNGAVKKPVYHPVEVRFSTPYPVMSVQNPEVVLTEIRTGISYYIKPSVVRAEGNSVTVTVPIPNDIKQGMYQPLLYSGRVQVGKTKEVILISK
jgi:hypothetical protein